MKVKKVLITHIQRRKPMGADYILYVLLALTCLIGFFISKKLCILFNYIMVNKKVEKLQGN